MKEWLTKRSRGRLSHIIQERSLESLGPDVIDKIHRATVRIHVSGKEGRSNVTGVCLDNGCIVTVDHGFVDYGFAENGARTIELFDNEGGFISTAEPILRDRRFDIAVLRPAKSVPSGGVSLSTRPLEVGQTLYTAGRVTMNRVDGFRVKYVGDANSLNIGVAAATLFTIFPEVNSAMFAVEDEVEPIITSPYMLRSIRSGASGSGIFLPDGSLVGIIQQSGYNLLGYPKPLSLGLGARSIVEQMERG